MESRNVYLDNAATTQLDPEVFEYMMPFFQDKYGNPSSIHSLGRKSKSAIEQARKAVAQILHTSPSEIFFTSGGTESNNLVLSSAARDLGVKSIITSPIEHHCILHTAEHLLAEKQIDTLHLLQIDSSGQINLAELESKLQELPAPSLVTIMYANNEIGTIAEIEKIATLCKQYKAYFHTDSVQALGHVQIDLSQIPIDFMTGSAHKFHGPKGVGLLYMRAATHLKPMIYGGSQEMNMRAGTENLYGIIGLAKALEIAYRDYETTAQHIQALKDHFVQKLSSVMPDIIINGGRDTKSLAKVVNISFPCHPKAELLLFNLDIHGICASSGSACSSGSEIGSHVLRAIHSPSDRNSIRFSFSKYNTIEELDYTIAKLQEIFS